MAYSRRSAPYEPGQKEVYKLSRSKIELFMQCPRCFWLDVRMGIKRPAGPPFQINKAIDELFKKEFDSYREQKKPHPLMTKYKIQAIPFAHEHLDKWRHNFSGVTKVHEPTNLHIFGAVDDVWINDDEELIVVDYKATSKNKEVSLDADWQISYKRQMEIYQWLLKQNDFKVCDKGYFVYTNARMDLEDFNDRVEFKTKVIEYEGNSDWVEPAIEKMKKCMDSDIPEVGTAAMGGPCDFCEYAKKRTELTLKHLNKKV